MAFGLLIPIFFVTSGMGIDPRAVAERPFVLVGFVVVILLVRGGPIYVASRLQREAGTSTPVFSPRDSLRIALYGATGLPIIVAVTEVAVRNGHMAEDSAALLVAGGAITVLLLPMVASLLGPRAPAPTQRQPTMPMNRRERPRQLLRDHGASQRRSCPASRVSGGLESLVAMAAEGIQFALGGSGWVPFRAVACLSGLKSTPRKRVRRDLRGFKSLRHRQLDKGKRRSAPLSTDRRLASVSFRLMEGAQAGPAAGRRGTHPRQRVTRDSHQLASLGSAPDKKSRGQASFDCRPTATARSPGWSSRLGRPLTGWTRPHPLGKQRGDETC